MILIIAIFYFLMIRPQQRKEKERREQVSALRAGAKILFCGGMIGTISEVRDATFLVSPRASSSRSPRERSNGRFRTRSNPRRNNAEC